MTAQGSALPLVKLKNLCERITVGHVGSMADRYSATGIPFLRSQNISPFQLNLDNLKFIPSDFHRELRKSALWAGDVAVVRTGYPGTACVIPDGFGELNCADLVVITPAKELNPHYLAAVFNSAWGTASVAANLVGVAQQHFNVSAAKELAIRLPPRSVQDRIARTLMNYNELIENSQRRVGTLEQIVRTVYDEWFASYPDGTPSGVSVEPPDLPVGWDLVPFTDLANVRSGGTPNTKIAAFWDGGIPFFTPRDAPRGFYALATEKHVSELGLSECASDLYPAETVFITARGTVGKVALAGVPMAMNQSCYALCGRRGIPQRYLYLLTLQKVEYLRRHTGGATFDTIVVDTFQRMRVARPPMDVITKFSKTVDPLFDQIAVLQRQVENLRATRDMLLPRLLSGQTQPAA